MRIVFLYSMFGLFSDAIVVLVVSVQNAPFSWRLRTRKLVQRHWNTHSIPGLSLEIVVHDLVVEFGFLLVVCFGDMARTRRE